MADQEVIKHTKKVYKIWNSKEHSVFTKIQEFVIEVVIIVFAVSLSIWLHGRSEHSHQQEEVKIFLTGLKEDLTNDIDEMRNDIESFKLQTAAFKYLSNLKKGEKANQDSLDKYSGWIFNQTGLVQNNGRFEGFKSSGKIGYIESPKLQNDIMDLYQEDIPVLLNSTNNYVHTKEVFNLAVYRLGKRVTDSTSNFNNILSSDEVYFVARSLTNTQQILSRYQFCISKMELINRQIDSLYKN